MIIADRVGSASRLSSVCPGCPSSGRIPEQGPERGWEPQTGPEGGDRERVAVRPVEKCLNEKQKYGHSGRRAIRDAGCGRFWSRSSLLATSGRCGVQVGGRGRRKTVAKTGIEGQGTANATRRSAHDACVAALRRNLVAVTTRTSAASDIRPYRGPRRGDAGRE